MLRYLKPINAGRYKAGQPNVQTLCGVLMHSSLASGAVAKLDRDQLGRAAADVLLARFRHDGAAKAVIDIGFDVISRASA